MSGPHSPSAALPGAETPMGGVVSVPMHSTPPPPPLVAPPPPQVVVVRQRGAVDTLASIILWLLAAGAVFPFFVVWAFLTVGAAAQVAPVTWLAWMYIAGFPTLMAAAAVAWVRRRPAR